LRTRTAAVVLAILALTACSTPGGSPAARTPSVDSVASPALTASPGPDGARFPTSVSDDGRYFLDQAGDPWFGRGDTGWSLIGQLGPQDVDLYLDDRAARGFNLVLVRLLEHHYSDNAPNNYRDDPPFTETPFQSAPNEAYWRHVDYVIEAARLRGITILLCPAYLGFGTTEGWSEEAVDATNADMAEFGGFLRDRYGDFPNIIWLIGHDRIPDDTEKARSEALAAELPQDDLVGLSARPDALGSEHWSPTAISPDFETVYNYDDLATSDTARAWQMQPSRPVVFLEGRYEQERSGGLGDPMLRRQNYGAFAAGAVAVLFGNNPMWHFESVSLYEYEGTWQDNLDSLGTGDMQRFGDLVTGLPWWEMQPDIDDEFLVDGAREDNLAARFSDSHAVVYVPMARAVVLDLGMLSAADRVELRRLDPRSGDSEVVGEHAADGLVVVRNPGPNAAGDDDWVYVLSPI
jgi:hypothetical protein